MDFQPRRWFWGLIPLAALWLIAGFVNNDRIQADLTKRATEQALAARSHGLRDLCGPRRDAVRRGASPEARPAAAAAVASVHGVRLVRDGATVLAEQKPWRWTAVRDGAKLTLGGFVPARTGRPAPPPRSGASSPALRSSTRRKRRAALHPSSGPRRLCAGAAREAAGRQGGTRRCHPDDHRLRALAGGLRRRHSRRSAGRRRRKAPDRAAGREALCLAGREAGRNDHAHRPRALGRCEGCPRRAGGESRREHPRGGWDDARLRRAGRLRGDGHGRPRPSLGPQVRRGRLVDNAFS